MKAAYVAILAAGTLPGAVLAQQVTYTAGQAAAGRTAYAEHCAECHLATMLGSFEAPELAGPNFLNYWGGRSVGELLDVATTMPPEDEDSLGDDVYASIVAYILRQNGFPAGPQVLAMSAQNPLDGGTGIRPADEPVAVASAGRGGGGGRGGRPGGTRTFTPVEDFRPVTDAELIEPDPGDWLMYRRTYDSWGNSPLDQINRDNVTDLRLAWVWAMEDGVNQPTPLVRDGVMYLTNPSNTIQALDAASGTLLWEYRRAFPEGFGGGGFSQLRAIAIYGDKIYVPTKDASMVALDARTGEIVWETEVADFRQGYTNVAGPLIVRIVASPASGLALPPWPKASCRQP